jgi:RIO-like serine/threonine protein kinase
MQLIKELKGHSGASVLLYDDNTVVKTGYSKARESVAILESLPFPTPKIYDVTDDTIVMQYVNGEDMASYLERADNERVDLLIAFIEEYFNWCLDNSIEYTFDIELDDKVISIGEYVNVQFIADNLKYAMPKSIIHGDFTFDNMLFVDDQFYLIDANPTNLNSVHFDGSKLRQDIDGFWFLRNRENDVNYKISCQKISEHLKSKYSFMKNNYLYSLMLSRILPYTKDKKTLKFLTKELDKVWP